jgi:hypothetical protein
MSSPIGALGMAAMLWYSWPQKSKQGIKLSAKCMTLAGFLDHPKK